MLFFFLKKKTKIFQAVKRFTFSTWRLGSFYSVHWLCCPFQSWRGEEQMMRNLKRCHSIRLPLFFRLKCLMTVNKWKPKKTKMWNLLDKQVNINWFRTLTSSYNSVVSDHSSVWFLSEIILWMLSFIPDYIVGVIYRNNLLRFQSPFETLAFQFQWA